jgi:hypothetical protein
MMLVVPQEIVPKVARVVADRSKATDRVTLDNIRKAFSEPASGSDVAHVTRFHEYISACPPL